MEIMKNFTIKKSKSRNYS